MAEKIENNISIPNELPLIALKNAILFPKVVIPIIVHRTKSMEAIDFALARDRLVMVAIQKNMNDDVEPKDIFNTGTVGRIAAVSKSNDGTMKVDIEGLVRADISEYQTQSPFFKVKIKPFNLLVTDNLEERALARRAIEQFRTVSEARSFPTILPEIIYMMSQIKDTEQIISLITVNLDLELDEQQKILNLDNALDALRELNIYLAREIEILETEKNVAKETKKQIGKMQKEMFLREQLKSIEKELGVDDEKGEIDSLKEKIEAANMPKEAKDKALKELSRLSKMPGFNPEASYLRTYLDVLADLPWSKKTDTNIDLTEAQKVLDQDHYGLKKVKERIIEFLAVQKQVGKIKGPILCLVGPPGTGKTSIGQSIARALGRKFIRVSLGGLRDEAEIRGHRRTYVGAMPGRIIQGIQNAGVSNPVFMLDELDKIGMDFRGDPSAALLEALDPQQNNAFSDHYLELPFDLSDVMFIATANVLDTIPPALRDRLEIIEFSGYTEEEKLHIANNFIIPRLLTDHGLKKKDITIQDSAISDIISNHTREAGVRDLERQLATVTRKVTRKIVESKNPKKISVDKKSLHSYLGPIRFTHQKAEKKDEVGVVTGLGWTPVGGELLTIEATKMPGSGKMILTGQLGSVMKESAQAALSYARAYLGDKKSDVFSKNDIHIHVPAGAVKKDGPSAGLAIATALISLFSNRAVRKDVAMTGELTLRGKALAIGGVKDKILAAHRAGIKTIILPFENKVDMEDVPKEVMKSTKFIFVKHMDEVLNIALRK